MVSAAANIPVFQGSYVIWLQLHKSPLSYLNIGMLCLKSQEEHSLSHVQQWTYVRKFQNTNPKVSMNPYLIQILNITDLLVRIIASLKKTHDQEVHRFASMSMVVQEVQYQYLVH